MLREHALSASQEIKVFPSCIPVFGSCVWPGPLMLFILSNASQRNYTMTLRDGHKFTFMEALLAPCIANVICISANALL